MDDILRGIKKILTGDEEKEDERFSPSEQPPRAGPRETQWQGRPVKSSDEDPYGDPGRNVKSSDEDPYGDPGRNVKSSDEDPYGDPGRR